MRLSYVFAAMIILAGSSFVKVDTLEVSSTAFMNNGMIPLKYSCEGQETNPPLNIAGIPARAQAIAIIVHDPDAPVKGGVTHWVMWNAGIDGNIPENYTGAEQGLNSGHEHNFKGMCPPSGEHRYYFNVYALDRKLDIDKNTDKAGLEKAMVGHILATGTIVGRYKKARQDVNR